MIIDKNGNWKLYWGAMPLPEGSEAIGTVETRPGKKGALIVLQSGIQVQGNAGSISSLPQTHGGKRPGAGRPSIYAEPLKTRGIKLSDEEYEKVKEFIKILRSEKNDGMGNGIQS